ncbi:hypothetical protein ASPACDRAFT_38740 [Aspergillus aculeatus ATCC 16872]|uniref:Uncharacterized protein n=1 Tax=Aspergillus aculeatus (strain ATCC 16872 / CBS 172.66 / WB 5094) TaxID=690307 RepID=A0A1L9X9R3_ASPA1|nr:uncharacterized protein ASPACDRAFT_38740 [Aspergillus aculeatus ATCC 16872]OJK05171.1 hypothetical protein ASPACDRAFT_38740 [Aspergillus aculeatus ATCC 16872]
MFAPFKFAVLLTIWFLATLTLASETFGAVGTVHDDESFIAIPLAMHEHDPRDVTIVKTICETTTSVISTTGPANPPATGTTGLPPANPTSQASSHSETQSVPPAPPTTVPGTVVQPPVTSKPEGVSPTSVPGTTGQTSAQPPVTSKTEAAPSTTSNTKETGSLPSNTSHSASPVSSSVQDVTHSVTTLTTTHGTSSAASGTHTTAPPSSEAAGNGGLRAALLAFAATFVIFLSI